MEDFLIDVTQLLAHKRSTPTGILRVNLEYVRHFKERSTALIHYRDMWIELSKKHSLEIFELLLDPLKRPNFSLLSTLIRSLPRNLGGRYFGPRFLLQMTYSGLNEITYVDRLKGSGLRPLFFVYDMIPLSHPECFVAKEADSHRRRIETITETGSGVITCSHATAKALKDYAHANNLPLPPSVIAPLAPALLPTPQKESFLDKPYFVMLGTIEPRKNHWLMLQIWKQLVENLGEKAPCLVIIGTRGWENGNVFALLDRSPLLKKIVLEKSNCSDEELATWLKHARALLFPSFIEGYGMPLVEALAVGTPVIASDIGVFREIAGDIPEYIDPLKTKRWAQLIVEYMQPNSLMRQEQCIRIANFKAPTWEEHFEKVEAFVEQLCTTQSPIYKNRLHKS